jgi:hypothetical protein
MLNITENTGLLGFCQNYMEKGPKTARLLPL